MPNSAPAARASPAERPRPRPGLAQRGGADPQLAPFSKQGSRKDGRAGIGRGADVGDRLQLQLGLAGAARDHRQPQRPRTALGHRARRGQMIGEGVVDHVARAEAGRVHGAREAPIVGPRPFGIVDRPRRREDAGQTGDRRGVEPAEGRIGLACSSFSSDLRSTGRRARSARVGDGIRIDAGQQPPQRTGHCRARGGSVPAGHGRSTLAVRGVAHLLAIVVGGTRLRHRPSVPAARQPALSRHGLQAAGHAVAAAQFRCRWRAR